MTATSILNAIPSYVLTVVISAVLLFVVKAVHTYVHNKALTAKTVQAKQLWSFIDQVATTAVNSLVSSNKPGDQKFSEATQMVQQSLNRQGFTSVDIKAIEAAVQSAYEKSDLTLTKSATPVETQVGPVVDGRSTVDPVLQAIETAPNRANDVKEG